VGTIVVGVDGSPASRRALDWAVAEGAAHRWDVHAIYAWQHAEAPVVPARHASYQDHIAEARRVLDDVVESTDTRPLPHPVERIVCEGGAGRVLVDASHGAQLVVVGARGLGGMTRLLLGSVSTYVVHHAACPVLVVRE
jgi:nucleotide-binding universal stress UspA family protein